MKFFPFSSQKTLKSSENVNALNAGFPPVMFEKQQIVTIDAEVEILITTLKSVSFCFLHTLSFWIVHFFIFFS